MYIACMARLLDSPADRSEAEALSALAYTNPFLPKRIECERRVLGEEFDDGDAGAVWSLHLQRDRERPNLVRLRQRAEAAWRARRIRCLWHQRGIDYALSEAALG